MRMIKAKPLSVPAFQPYGMYRSLLEMETDGDAKTTQLPHYFPDVISFPVSDIVPVGVSVGRVVHDNYVIPFLEYHSNSSEGRLPLNGDIVIYVGKPVQGELSVEDVEAFIVPKGTFILLKPGVVHGRQFSLKESHIVHVMLLAMQATVANDMVSKQLTGEERAQIVL